MKPNWHLVVSFKTELLSEYLIHKGYRESLCKLLPKVGLLRNRMNIDNDIYIDLNEVQAIQEILNTNIIDHANDAYTAIEQQSQRLIHTAQNLARNLTENLSSDEIAARLRRFFGYYQSTLGAIGIPTIIDLALEKRVKERLIESGESAPDIAFMQLAISYRSVGTVQEHTDLLSIASEFERQGLINLSGYTFNAIEKQYPYLAEQIKRHVQKYGWIYSTLFLGEIYDEVQVFEEIKVAVGKAEKEISRQVVEREKQETVAHSVIERINTREGQEEALLLQKAIYFRTVRLEWMNHACFIVRPLMELIAQRIELSFDDLIYLFPQEIEAALVNNIPPNKHKVMQRKESYALISDETQQYVVVTGNRVQELKQKFNPAAKSSQIKGLVACKGFVTGRVVIVKDRSELSKVQKGDILVTPLTTPDFIIVMKEAAAIITDLGGLTSHAAIVSRELAKPCIVGTQHASKVFKDGDLVEVDAEKGMVRIINSV